MTTKLETKRLILRPWREDDAEALFKYASDPRVGPAAGWPVHTSVENSREIIKTVLGQEGIFAVTLKGDDSPIGSAGLQKTTAPGYDGELEIGYWIGVPFWGQGLIPEAVEALLELAFGALGVSRVWCAHYEGNEKSRRVIEKCGFQFALDRTAEVLGESRRELYYTILR